LIDRDRIRLESNLLRRMLEALNAESHAMLTLPSGAGAEAAVPQ